MVCSRPRSLLNPAPLAPLFARRFGCAGAPPPPLPLPPLDSLEADLEDLVVGHLRDAHEVEEPLQEQVGVLGRLEDV
jgi:hypothetical protein